MIGEYALNARSLRAVVDLLDNLPWCTATENFDSNPRIEFRCTLDYFSVGSSISSKAVYLDYCAVETDCVQLFVCIFSSVSL